MSEPSHDDWLSKPEYQPGLPFFQHLDEATAARLYNETDQQLRTMAVCIANPRAVRGHVPAFTLAQLADMFDEMSHLADALDMDGGPGCALALPHVVKWRDLAAAEAIKRGSVLVSSEDLGMTSRAELLALYIAARLGPVAAKGRTSHG